MNSLKMGLFGKSSKKDPKEMVNEWCQKMRKENCTLDRQIRGIMREEQKANRSLKEAAKKNDKESCLILAKEIVNARKVIRKLQLSKTQLNSIQMQMRNQLSVVKVAGSMQKSSEVMQMMSKLVQIPEISATMKDMSKEMMKAGIIEEMLNETMDSAIDDPEDMEEEIQSEVDKVLWELTAGALGKAPATVTDTPGASVANQPAAVAADEDKGLEEMKNRLQALRT